MTKYGFSGVKYINAEDHPTKPKLRKLVAELDPLYPIHADEIRKHYAL